jgi:hypothetical protein
MSKLDVKLFANGMRNIIISKVDNDGNFIVGDIRCSCPWFVAVFPSPKIAQLHALGPLIYEFEIETRDDKQEFDQFLCLGFRQSFLLDENSLLFVDSIVRELGNYERYGLKCPERLRESETFYFASEKLISFAASHFYHFNSSQVWNIPFSPLSQIRSHTSLQIPDEDSLCDLLSKYFEPSRVYFSLVEYLRIP